MSRNDPFYNKDWDLITPLEAIEGNLQYVGPIYMGSRAKEIMVSYDLTVDVSVTRLTLE
jgi:hypothetical protein